MRDDRTGQRASAGAVTCPDARLTLARAVGNRAFTRLARACLPAAECAVPQTSLTNFVQETENKPENKSKADKRAENCAKGKPECTSDGHAAPATAIIKILQDRSPKRLDYVSGIFVNKDMPADYGAVTVDCASFTPPLPIKNKNPSCTTVPASMEAEAKQYLNPKNRKIGGLERYAWLTQMLMTITHETEHGRFTLDTMDPKATFLKGPSTAGCSPADVGNDLTEMAAQMSEFPILLRRIQPFSDSIRKQKLAAWFQYHLSNGSEDVTGTLKSLRCRCECTDVDNYVKQTAEWAQKAWNSYEKSVYNTEMKDPAHGLKWPVDPPAAVDINDLPSATPTYETGDLQDLPAKTPAP